MNGSVLQLNVKPRTAGEAGLPKLSAPRVDVTELGVGGDYNDWRAENLPGDRKQAVLLVTDEIIGQLQREGWPVEPGHLGENVTLSGVPESALGPGVRLAIGDVLLEISEACEPCTRLYSLPYVGAEKGPAFLRTLTGRRGWFARVLKAGAVERGAPVKLVFAPGAASSATPI